MESSENFYPKCSKDDNGLPHDILWQDQICFPGFHMGSIYGMELVEGFGAKVNK